MKHKLTLSIITSIKKLSLASEMEELERLSLVSRVCVELDNHFGLADKDVAEFIIYLATENPTFDKFKKSIIKEGLSDQVCTYVSFVMN